MSLFRRRRAYRALIRVQAHMLADRDATIVRLTGRVTELTRRLEQTEPRPRTVIVTPAAPATAISADDITRVLEDNDRVMKGVQA
ncbi:hypothetical protein [Streptomyces sp. UH6]|uniref:hypothetical protein n=1 Tax=Streptomyces sp. UH6 TaxID=2748379 RepID=UPI0015D4D655|nr:hypothetical protein [Streptomyces sp. UH6]NYV73660.1 hypothetical protein [Streptomyces sp. UH6]